MQKSIRMLAALLRLDRGAAAAAGYAEGAGSLTGGTVRTRPAGFRWDSRRRARQEARRCAAAHRACRFELRCRHTAPAPGDLPCPHTETEAYRAARTAWVMTRARSV